MNDLDRYIGEHFFGLVAAGVLIGYVVLEIVLSIKDMEDTND